jgi:hypothetical protein
VSQSVAQPLGWHRAVVEREGKEPGAELPQPVRAEAATAA